MAFLRSSTGLRLLFVPFLCLLTSRGVDSTDAQRVVLSRSLRRATDKLNFQRVRPKESTPKQDAETEAVQARMRHPMKRAGCGSGHDDFR